EDGIRDLIVTGVQTCALPIFVEPLPPMLRGRTALILANIPFVPPNEAPRFAYLAPTAAIRGPSADGLVLLRDLALQASALLAPRSEERRVGKECRSRWSPSR